MRKLAFTIFFITSLLLSACTQTPKPETPTPVKTIVVLASGEEVVVNATVCLWSNSNSSSGLACYEKVSFEWDAIFGRWVERYDPDSIVFSGQAQSYRVEISGE